MIATMSVAIAMAAAQGVPVPRNFPKTEFVGGPLQGLMGELRGEKVKPLPQSLAVVVDQIFEVGEGREQRNLKVLVIDSAVQSFESRTYPDTGWSGKIEPGFLAKFKGCAHTAPWFDGAQGHGVDKAHFYWSCDAQNPYILRTTIRFKDGKVESWKADDFFPLIMAPANGGMN